MKPMQRRPFLPRAGVTAFAFAALAALQPAAAQTIEDHSLPRSVVKTLHVKCPNGRLAMIRWDTREEPLRLCVLVQDGSRPQQCERVAQAALDQALLKAKAGQVCRE